MHFALKRVASGAQPVVREGYQTLGQRGYDLLEQLTIHWTPNLSTKEPK